MRFSLTSNRLVLFDWHATATEKIRQLGAHFARAGSDRGSLSLPKKEKLFVPTLDTISLIDTAGSIDSLDSGGDLMTSKHLSNSMLDMSGLQTSATVFVQHNKTALQQHCIKRGSRTGWKNVILGIPLSQPGSGLFCPGRLWL